MAYSANSQKKYNEKFIFITLKLHNEKDRELLEMIERLTATGMSKQAAVKALITKNVGQ